MTRVLIAADESEEAVRAADAAHKLFGDGADYFVINVSSSPVDYAWAAGWGIAAPVTLPIGLNNPALLASVPDTELDDNARERAADVAKEASLTGAEPLGDVGDPATAILDAARAHEIDVIVVGSHRRNWFDRLVAPSVSKELIRDADVPVLVVP